MMHYALTLDRTWHHSWAGFVLVFLCNLGFDVQDSHAQEKKAIDTTSELTEGLLDLLNEPESTAEAKPPNEAAVPSILPSDVGLDGEDLGEKSNDPLRSVRQSMIIAAEFLNRGVTGKTTQTLQGDIVGRLDDLIQQIEEAQQNQQNSNSKSESTSQDSSQSQQSQQSSTNSEQIKDPTSEQSEEKRQPSPGDQGEKSPVQTKLSDPKVLQEQVWGQLPERIRKQMRSTMVEQFLPSHREQIQAYFEALLKEKM